MKGECNMIYRVEGGSPLYGSVKIGGSKNAVLPILFATLLTRGKSLLTNVPAITDVESVLSLLQTFGARICRPTQDAVEIDTTCLSYTPPPEAFTRTIRASTYLIGACLGRFGKIDLPAFGGCSFCERPIDLHLKAVQAFGGEIQENQIICKQLLSNRVVFPRISVGATVNGLLLASQIEEESILENVAIEPHVLSLIAFLRIAGCRISILRSPRPTFFVRGGKLQGVKMRMIPDMIEAGTYLLSAFLTGGKVTVNDIDPSHLTSFFSLMEHAGATVFKKERSATLFCKERSKRIHITCAPYPAVATDLSPILSAMLARYGMGSVKDTVFPQRNSFLSPYHSLGANFLTQEDGSISFLPPDPPRAHTVSVPDLRSGAGLILYALSLPTTTVIDDTHGYLLRGYENFTEKINALGAYISEDAR